MRRHLEPGPDHPITIKHKAIPVSVNVADGLVITSNSHLELREASYPVVVYLPRHEINLASLERSDHTTWCPYKGEASYFHILTPEGAKIENAVWTYEIPFPAVADIKYALAFYPDKVERIEFVA